MRYIDISEFEEVFNVSIGDDEADSVTTVGSALELIKKKLA